MVKFQFHMAAFHLGGAEIAEHAEVSAFPHALGNGLGELDAVADADEINVDRRAVEHHVAHAATYGIAFAGYIVGHSADSFENLIFFSLDDKFGDVHASNVMSCSGALVRHSVAAAPTQ